MKKKKSESAYTKEGLYMYNYRLSYILKGKCGCESNSINREKLPTRLKKDIKWKKGQSF